MCYKRLEEPLAFDDARTACQADGADLASASTPEKNTIVSGLAGGQRCWVGAVVEAGKFLWSYIYLCTTVVIDIWTKVDWYEHGKMKFLGYFVLYFHIDTFYTTAYNL